MSRPDARARMLRINADPALKAHQMRGLARSHFVTWTTEMDAALRLLRKRKVSQSRCARLIGVDRGTLTKRMDQLGLPRGRRLP